MMRRTFALCIVAFVGCRHELDSINPEQRIETYLWVPAHDHAFVVAAEIMVPLGYKDDVGRRGERDFVRRRRDPDVYIRSTLTSWAPDVAPTPYEPDPGQIRHCESRVDEQARAMNRDSFGDVDARVMQREVRATGDVVVCKLRDSIPRRLSETYVARNYRWRDYDFQCVVRFRVQNDLDVPYDEGNPSTSRIRDAIAICDTFEIREMRHSDLERFFPVPAEELGKMPPAEWWSRLYPPTR